VPVTYLENNKGLNKDVTKRSKDCNCEEHKMKHKKCCPNCLPSFAMQASTRRVVGFQFREEFFLQQLKCDFLVGDQDHVYSLTPAIAKMLHNVHKGLRIGKHSLRKPFTVDSLS
jgi:hypothetical protein